MLLCFFDVMVYAEVQQFLSIPVYTIFKNLTIILIVSVIILSRHIRCFMFVLLQAYGEVIWFGGRVTGVTLVSFIFMVRVFLSCF